MEYYLILYLSILVAVIVGFAVMKFGSNNDGGKQKRERSNHLQKIQFRNQQDISFLNMVSSIKDSTVTGTTFPSGFKVPSNGKWTVKKIENKWYAVQISQ